MLNNNTDITWRGGPHTTEPDFHMVVKAQATGGQMPLRFHLKDEDYSDSLYVVRADGTIKQAVWDVSSYTWNCTINANPNEIVTVYGKGVTSFMYHHHWGNGTDTSKKQIDIYKGMHLMGLSLYRLNYCDAVTLHGDDFPALAHITGGDSGYSGGVLRCDNLPAVTSVAGEAFKEITLGDCPLLTTLDVAETNIETITIGECPLLAPIADMFFNCTALVSAVFGNMGSASTDGSLNCSNMFHNCRKLVNMPTGDMINYRAINDAASMFNSCDKLTSVANGDFTFITNTANMFYRNFKLATFESGISFPAVTSARSMFHTCLDLVAYPNISMPACTDLTSTWAGCTKLVNFPLIDTSVVTTLSNTWLGCTALTTFPLIDTGAVTNFTSAWERCSGLTTFPLIDVSGAVELPTTWKRCTGLTTFPVIDTSMIVRFPATWERCSALSNFPVLDYTVGEEFVGCWNAAHGAGFPSVTMPAVTNLTNAWYSNFSMTATPGGTIKAGCNMNGAFSRCAYLTSVTPSLWVSGVSTMSGTFAFCGSLQSTGVFNVSTVTDISYAWRRCGNLNTISHASFPMVTNANNAWDQCGKLYTMPAMSLPLVETMNQTWYKCTTLTSFPALTLGSVLSMVETFDNCRNVVTYGAMDLSTVTDISKCWYYNNSMVNFPAYDLSSVLNANEAWKSCFYLRAMPEVNLTSCTTMTNTWGNCYVMTQTARTSYPEVIDATGAWTSCHSLNLNTGVFDFPKATNLSNTFLSCRNIGVVGGLNAPLATTVTGTFNGCYRMREITTLNIPSATSTEYMFNNCKSLNVVPTTIVLPALTTAKSMFSGCQNLVTAPTLTTPCTLFERTFGYCFSLTDANNIDYSTITHMRYMFYKCVSLVSIPTGSYPLVTNMDSTFGECTALTDISTLNAPLCEKHSNTFKRCISLKSVPALTLPAATNVTYMFFGCSSLEDFAPMTIPDGYDATSMFAGCASLRSVDMSNMLRPTKITQMFAWSGLCYLNKMDFGALTHSADPLPDHAYMSPTAIDFANDIAYGGMWVNPVTALTIAHTVGSAGSIQLNTVGSHTLVATPTTAGVQGHVRVTVGGVDTDTVVTAANTNIVLPASSGCEIHVSGIDKLTQASGSGPNVTGEVHMRSVAIEDCSELFKDQTTITRVTLRKGCYIHNGSSMFEGCINMTNIPFHQVVSGDYRGHSFIKNRYKMCKGAVKYNSYEPYATRDSMEITTNCESAYEDCTVFTHTSAKIPDTCTNAQRMFKNSKAAGCSFNYVAHNFFETFMGVNALQSTNGTGLMINVDRMFKDAGYIQYWTEYSGRNMISATDALDGVTSSIPSMADLGTSIAIGGNIMRVRVVIDW